MLAPESFCTCVIVSPPLPIIAPAAIDGTNTLRWTLSAASGMPGNTENKIEMK